jgi:uncharacterized protein
MHPIWIAMFVFAAAVISGATGLGFPLLAAPVFLIDNDPPQAILITSVCSLMGQLFAIVILRRSVQYELRWKLLLPGLLGVPVGTCLLLLLDTSVPRIGLAVLLILSSIWLMTGRSTNIQAAPRFPEWLVGVSGGICGGLFGVSAVLPAAWLSASGFDKLRQRAIIQPYVIAAQSLSLTLLCYHDSLTASVVRAILLNTVPLLIGIAAGTAAFRIMSSGTYSRAVLTITLLSGLMLLCR